MSEQMTAIMERRFVYLQDDRQQLLLERAFWLRLEDLCRREKTTVHDFCSGVTPAEGDGIAAAIRVKVLDYFCAAATEEGHRAAGHGS